MKSNLLQRIRLKPCLWFDHQAEEAVHFYTSIFENSKTGNISRYGESGSQVSGQKKGSVMAVDFELDGQNFTALNGGPIFKFSPTISFFIACDSESKMDQLWSELSTGGSVLWELKKYPWAEKYGWCQDRFGVYWQIILEKRKSTIAPAFLFTDKIYGQGESAIQFYLSIFSNSKIESIQHDPKTNTILHAHFCLDGQSFILMEGAGVYNYEMTPAISFVVNCETQEEIDRYWDLLTSDGGQESQCGWLQDKFGVSWQIVPENLGQLMSGSEPAQSEKIMKALLQMKKINIDGLKKAHD